MKLSEVVSFRKDLLFNGAVQIGWLEIDRYLANKAAESYVFHGPDYHGVAEYDFEGSTYRLLDTASFTVDILRRMAEDRSDDPFTLAIAGYGTGKSHLAITLASLFGNPDGETANTILCNLTRADAGIGNRTKNLLDLIDCRLKWYARLRSKW